MITTWQVDPFGRPMHMETLDESPMLDDPPPPPRLLQQYDEGYVEPFAFQEPAAPPPPQEPAASPPPQELEHEPETVKKEKKKVQRSAAPAAKDPLKTEAPKVESFKEEESSKEEEAPSIKEREANVSRSAAAPDLQLEALLLKLSHVNSSVAESDLQLESLLLKLSQEVNMNSAQPENEMELTTSPPAAPSKQAESIAWHAAVPFTLTLELDFNAIGDHEAFKQDVIKDVGTAANVSAKYMKIVALSAGSVIVDMLIASEAGEPTKIVQGLLEQLKTPNSLLMRGKFTSKTTSLNPAPFAALPQSLTAPPPTALPDELPLRIAPLLDLQVENASHAPVMRASAHQGAPAAAPAAAQAQQIRVVEKIVEKIVQVMFVLSRTRRLLFPCRLFAC
jgi:hypothetical protein